MEQRLRIQSEETIQIHKKQLTQTEKHISELDRLFIRIYENTVAGRLDDEKFFHDEHELRPRASRPQNRD